MNESETLNRSFTIILAVHQPFSIILHVTYVYICVLLYSRYNFGDYFLLVEDFTIP